MSYPSCVWEHKVIPEGPSETDSLVLWMRNIPIFCDCQAKTKDQDKNIGMRKQFYQIVWFKTATHNLQWQKK